MTSHETEPAKTYPAQRIVGALVLLALAVIIIPMVLDFRKGYDVSIDKTNIPPRPDDFRVEVLPLLEDSRPEAPSQVVSSAPVEALAPSEPAPATQVEAPEAQSAPVAASGPPAARPPEPATAKGGDEKPVVKTARGAKPQPSPVSAPKPKAPPQPAEKPAPRKALPPPSTLPPPSAWVLQVGNFSSSKNAHALRERLRRNGFRAFVDEQVKGGARTYRVFVGPELVKVNTDILKRELKEDMNLNGIVIPYER